MPNFGPHAALLLTELAPTFACFLNSHKPLQQLTLI
jgi:hypothetical protein